MNLCIDICILTGKSLEVFWDSCFSLHSFWVKNVEIDCFGIKMILSAILINLKCMWLQSGLGDLEKHQTHAFLLIVDFLRILKITHFFEIFERLLKTIKSTS